MNTAKSPHLMVLIPAFNEQARVGDVVRAVREAIAPDRIVVVDDGSVDDTAQAARQAGATVIELPVNLGYGAALQTGYRYALRVRAAKVLQMDADGQHRPETLNKLIDAQDEGDIVIGSRFLEALSYKMPWTRRIGVELFSRFAAAVSGQRVYDVTSGLQLIDRKVLPFLVSPYFPTDYPDADLLVLLRRCGFSIKEVAVGMKPSPPGKVSMHKGPKIIYYIYKMTLSIGLAIFERKPRYKGSAP